MISRQKLNQQLDRIFSGMDGAYVVQQFAQDGGIECQWAHDHVNAIVDRHDCDALLSQIDAIAEGPASNLRNDADVLGEMVRNEIERRHNDAVREQGGWPDEPHEDDFTQGNHP